MKAQVGVVDGAELAITPALFGPVGSPVPLLGAPGGIGGNQLLGDFNSLICAAITFFANIYFIYSTCKGFPKESFISTKDTAINSILIL